MTGKQLRDTIHADHTLVCFIPLWLTENVYPTHFARFGDDAVFLDGVDGNGNSDGVAEDWPFTYEDLLPYQLEIEREVGVSGLSGDPAFPPRGTASPNFPFGYCGYSSR